jgi:hypothetical protein
MMQKELFICLQGCYVALAQELEGTSRATVEILFLPFHELTERNTKNFPDNPGPIRDSNQMYPVKCLESNLLGKVR